MKWFCAASTLLELQGDDHTREWRTTCCGRRKKESKNPILCFVRANPTRTFDASNASNRNGRTLQRKPKWRGSNSGWVSVCCARICVSTWLQVQSRRDMLNAEKRNKRKSAELGSLVSTDPIRYDFPNDSNDFGGRSVQLAWVIVQPYDAIF